MSSIVGTKSIQSELEFENDNPRFQKALKILELDDPIHEVKDGIYTVKAQGGYGLYKVEDTGEWKCNCPDYVTRGGACKHILATRYYLEVKRDEINTLNIASFRTFSDLWDILQFDSFPVLSSLIVRLWIGMEWIKTDAAIRIFGLIVGILVLAVLWFNARLIRNSVPLLSMISTVCPG